jgi:hypothetical protein
MRGALVSYQRATETLYNVQVAETQSREVRRQGVLNAILLLLTSFTLISVTADAYNFVRDQEVMIPERLDRVLILSEFVLALALLLAIAVYVTWPSRRRRRGVR